MRDWFSGKNKIKDSDLIAKVVQKDDEAYVSRIRNKNGGKNNRGKGLINIRNMIKNFNMEAKLVIISDRGCYNELSSGGEGKEEVTLPELEVPLQGTLVQWSIKLNFDYERKNY